MYQRIIITSGVSLIFNNKSMIEQGFPDFFSTPEPLTDESTVTSDEVIQHLTSELAHKESDELGKLSAELSMVNVLQKTDRLVKQPYITLFYTDTFKGRTAGFVNKMLLEKVYGATVRARKIFELNVNNRSMLNRALGKYLSDVSSALQEGEPKTTCFAPIGGYKVMTSLGYLAGALHNFPTAYLHEGSTVIHEIPAVNIEVNESFIQENHDLLKKFFVGDCFEYDQLSPEEKELIKKQTVMFDQVEGLVELNPFGRFLCDQDKYYKFFKSQIKFDKSLKRTIDRRYANYWENVYDEVKSLVFQFESKSANYRGTLYHESDFSSLKDKDLSYHLFKGGNEPIFRALWNYNETDDSYYIAQIWFDHDDYEREIVRTIESAGHKNDWVNITNDLYG